MVSATVVMLISSGFCSVAAIPDVRKLCHGGGLFPVQRFQKQWVNGPAIMFGSALVNFQALDEQLFMACHDVGKVAECLRCVSVCSNVDVYTRSDL